MTASSAFRAGGKVSRALRIYLAVLGGLWCVSLLIVAIRRFVFHEGYPFNTFLFTPDARFTDFTIYVPRFAAWGQSDRFFSLPGFQFDYPAPLLLSELAYFKLSTVPLYAYLATVILFAIAGGLLVAMCVPRERRIRPLAAAAALATAIFSFPLMFLIDRGNIEGLVWIVSSFGLLLFVMHRYSSSAVLFALAAAMKFFPGTLLLLFLAKRRYRDFCLAIAAFFAITTASLSYIGPTIPIAAQRIASGIEFFRKDQVLEIKPIIIGFEHSLFSLVKQVLFRVVHDVPRVNAILPRIYLGYGLCAFALFAFLYAAFIRKLPVLNQLLVLSALSVSLPFISYDYTLVHMFGPFAVLLLVLASDGAAGRLLLSQKQMLFLLLPFAVIFTPQSYLVHSVIGFAAQVKTGALFALVAAALSIPLPGSMFNELPERETLILDLALEPNRIGDREAPEPTFV
jgi:Glycosyltransferase family 87